MVALICISLIRNGVEHLMCLLTICMSSLETRLTQVFCLLSGLFVLILLSVISCKIWRLIPYQ